MTKEHSLALRIFHWLNALVVFFIILTIVVRENLLEKIHVRNIILKYSDQIGKTFTPDEAEKLAKIIRNEIWNLHYYLGIGLAILLLFRIVLLFTADGRKIFVDAFTVFKKQKAKRAGVKMIYVVFYSALMVMVVTGLLMYFHENLGISDDGKHSLESFHEGFVAFVTYFIPIHIIGVLIAEFSDEAGIVSTMINGKKSGNNK